MIIRRTAALVAVAATLALAMIVSAVPAQAAGSGASDGSQLIYDPCGGTPDGMTCVSLFKYTPRDADGGCDDHGILGWLKNNLQTNPVSRVTIGGVPMCSQSTAKGGLVAAGAGSVGSLTKAAAAVGEASIPARIVAGAGASAAESFSSYGSSGLRWAADAAGNLQLIGGLLSGGTPQEAGVQQGTDNGTNPATGMPQIGIFPEARSEWQADRDASGSEGLGSSTPLRLVGYFGSIIDVRVYTTPVYSSGALASVRVTASESLVVPGSNGTWFEVYVEGVQAECSDGYVASVSGGGRLLRARSAGSDAALLDPPRVLDVGSGNACGGHGGAVMLRGTVRAEVSVPNAGDRGSIAVPLTPGARDGMLGDAPSPTRTLTVSYQCGGAARSVSVSYTEGALGSDGTFNFPALPCEAGSVSGVKVDQQVGWGEPQRIFEIEDPQPEMVDAVSAAAGGAPAVLDLNVDGTSCFTDATLCVGWPTWNANQKSHLHCTYGGAAVELSHCNVYAPLWPADPNAAPEYGDPVTGERVIPDTQGQGQPGGGTDAGTGGFPLTGSSPSDPDAGNCISGAWSWNPVDWIFVPVKCALKWAFVPDAEAVSGAVQGIWADVSTKPPISLIAPVVTFVTGWADSIGSGCASDMANFGWALVIPCQPPAGIAGFIGVMRLLVMVAVGGFTMFGIWRMVEKSIQK